MILNYLKFNSLLVFAVSCFVFTFFQIDSCISVVVASENNVIIIQSQQMEAYNEAIESFKKGCKDKGISINSIYDLKGEIEGSKKVIRKIKKNSLKPDLIFTVGILAAKIVKEQFSDVPIIFSMVICHKRFNLQNHNITGISTDVPLVNQLSILKEILGEKKKVGIICDPTKIGNIISEAIPVASKLGLNLIKKEITSEGEVKSALKNIIESADSLWIIPDSTVITRDSLSIILKTTLSHKMPTFCTSSAIVRAGALASISPDYAHTGLEASKMAQTLLNSPTVISLGIKHPEKFKLSLNVQTANIIGIDISAFQSRPDVFLYP